MNWGQCRNDSKYKQPKPRQSAWYYQSLENRKDYHQIPLNWLASHHFPLHLS